MDIDIRTNIDELTNQLRNSGIDSDDPVAKLILAALMQQTRKIKDEVSTLPERVVDRLCACFIPKDKLDPNPALCYLKPSLKSRKGIEPHLLTEGTYFTYKIDSKLALSYHPIYRNTIIPYTGLHLLSNRKLDSKGSTVDLNLPKKGQVWVGLELPMETDSLEGVSLYLKGFNGLLPQGIYVDNGTTELTFSPANHLADIPMMEPFDAQQANPTFIEILNSWRNQLAETDGGRLIYITDKTRDRDIFKCRAFPKSFQQILESQDLDKFENNTLWILLDFGDGTDIPKDISVIPNVVPAVNVSLNTVTLTPSSPIARLTKGDGSQFLTVLETSLAVQKQGFGTLKEEVDIRDFDNQCYDPGILHRDVRNLYNRFIDDYHAFVDYHGLKDGELIRSLRDTVNRIGKSVATSSDIKNKFDEGTYAMRNINRSSQSGPIKVAYLTTFGRQGNLPKSGEIMENKKDPALEKEVKVIVSAEGGEDKATADERYEMLRYFSLTCDRLYTKMDIDAFLRMHLLKEFGKEEIKRISYEIKVQGAGGEHRLTRGLYIYIRFKDEKNHQKAIDMALDRRLQQMIADKSCISMPIIVKLINSENK